ncbi:MAG: hypothetical protein RBT11_00170 [Desulfobacterales bacterium]|jgi:hypothetical protein|nr:hypothetical protein [Desulfobacterales bacterium]
MTSLLWLNEGDGKNIYFDVVIIRIEERKSKQKLRRIKKASPENSKMLLYGLIFSFTWTYAYPLLDRLSKPCTKKRPSLEKAAGCQASQHPSIPASQHPSIPASQHPSIPASQHPSIPASQHPALPD